MRCLEFISDTVWGMPTVILILSAGIYFSARLKLPQITRIKEIFETVLKQFGASGKGALGMIATSLSATVGTGSVIGVATAITLGGAGAVFWLWVSAFFGMAVAYAEGVLSIKYRKKIDNGYKGGMSYALAKGLGARGLAAVYAVFGIFASLGMGSMAQTNSFAVSFESGLGISPFASAAVCTLVIGVCAFGKGRIAQDIALRLMPLLTVGYVAVALGVIIANYENLPSAFAEILSSAFGFRSVVGGAAGYGINEALSVGFRRGVFSNEAGLGTTAAVHAQAENVTPHEQGLINMFEVIIDTFVVCTLTALMILTSNAHCSTADGAELVILSCQTVFGRASGAIISIAIALFALATAIGWSQIGKKSAEYLLHGKSMLVYTIIYVISALIGCFVSSGGVFTISDIFNGLMVLPCMTALFLLSNEIVKACPSSQSHARRARSSQARQLLRPRGR